jgi:hypothetical protein
MAGNRQVVPAPCGTAMAWSAACRVGNGLAVDAGFAASPARRQPCAGLPMMPVIMLLRSRGWAVCGNSRCDSFRERPRRSGLYKMPVIMLLHSPTGGVCGNSRCDGFRLYLGGWGWYTRACMTVSEARKILGVGPDEDSRVHFRGFCVVRGDLVEGLAVPPPEAAAAVDFSPAPRAVTRLPGPGWAAKAARWSCGHCAVVPRRSRAALASAQTAMPDPACRWRISVIPASCRRLDQPRMTNIVAQFTLLSSTP